MPDGSIESESLSHVWPYSFNLIALAYSNRYPCPLSKHILSSDVISRSFNTENNILSTTKLVRKSGKLPRWAPKGIITKAETWVIEQTDLDLISGSLSSTTRNLDHRTVLDITEHLSFDRIDQSSCISKATASAKSSWGSDSSFFSSYLRQRIQSFSVNSFKRNHDRSKASLQLIINLLNHPQSTYAGHILDPARFPSGLPPDLLEDRFDRLATKWEESEAGFLGHGIHLSVEPDPPVASQPLETRPLTLAWLAAKWRLKSDPNEGSRSGLFDRIKTTVKSFFSDQPSTFQQVHSSRGSDQGKNNSPPDR